jgi:hypothetical protein
LYLSEIPTLVTLDMQENIYRFLKTPPSNWMILNDSLTHNDSIQTAANIIISDSPSFSYTLSKDKRDRVYIRKEQ